MTSLGQRRAVALGLLAIGLLSCGKTDPVGEAVQAAKDRSVPPGGRLKPLYGPSRGKESVTCSWEVETGMAWEAYAAWVTQQLAEFQVRQQDVDVLRLSQPLEADVYTLTLRPKRADRAVKVEVAFEARPF